MRHSAVAVFLCGLILMPGCGSFKTVPPEQVPFLGRAQTQERDGLRVTVSVLTQRETRQVFGVPLEKKKIQPVWIHIENFTDRPYWFMLSGVDPNYYSAREASYIFHSRCRGKRNREMDQHFEELVIDPFILPRCRSMGFCFSRLKRGVKEVRVRLFGERHVLDFEFHIPVPGLRTDWQAAQRALPDPEREIIEMEDEAALREALAALPATSTRKDGTGRGDPLNLIVIGGLRKPFSRAHWDETEPLTFGSAWRTVKSFFGKEYKHAPMSPLYVFGRPQDIGLQKARDSIHERNHLRLWLTPYTFRGKKVWAGTISRDIGVYFTTRAWNLTTHAIDPNVDEARDYLTEDLAMTQSLEKVGYIQGVSPSTPDRPHRNLLNAPYWTDGWRVVLEVTDGTVALEDIDRFPWKARASKQECELPLMEPRSSDSGL